jgi:hypothetical protein
MSGLREDLGPGSAQPSLQFTCEEDVGQLGLVVGRRHLVLALLDLGIDNHHGHLRDALLDAAERSIGELGVKQLSLRELARTVGVSHAAPRAHFLTVSPC